LAAEVADPSVPGVGCVCVWPAAREACGAASGEEAEADLAEPVFVASLGELVVADHRFAGPDGVVVGVFADLPDRAGDAFGVLDRAAAGVVEPLEDDGLSARP